ncbi:MAG TPA: hypothetical protein VK116_00720, partial [Planctomycetota bacterium]|nr:hypothetical protein [Planctomycetota bacterium]
MLERRRGAIGLSVLLVFLGGLGPSWAQGSADSDARQRVRELEEENESLSKKNVQLSSRIVETERAYEELKGRLKEVQSQAVTLAEQMSDASLAKRDMEERLDAMTKSHRGIEEENRRIRRELESLTEELKRKEVALDALSRLANKDSGEEAQSVALTRLRHELDEARRAARVAQSDRLGL